MPELARINGYIIRFYSSEFFGNKLERPHVHVVKGGSVAKFWLDTGEFSSSKGFKTGELKEIHGIVNQRREIFLEQWNEHFTQGGTTDGDR